MGRYSRLRRIRQVDPQQDFERIYRWIVPYEFPRDYLHGTPIAFLRDFGVPRIPRLLATTVVGPKRWIDRFGRRRLSEQETESLALAGRRTGEMMGISGVPGTYAAFERLHDDYEREMFAYDPAHRRGAAAALRVMASWYPAPVRRPASRVALAVLDEPLLKALGFRPEPRRLRAAVHRALRVRAAPIRLLPGRPEWLPRTPEARAHPFGWTLDDLGPHWAHSRPPHPLHDETPPEGACVPARASAPDAPRQETR
ncbi:oxygenase MpaB family protein [Streptomyces sp. NPDC085946]|uniref:oxygenase MpaB family protein n=1 Tax=Streptomyces sp. NPDC085946 TaxID=3365744 RepID=UPI0037CE088C